MGPAAPQHTTFACAIPGAMRWTGSSPADESRLVGIPWWRSISQLFFECQKWSGQHFKSMVPMMGWYIVISSQGSLRPVRWCGASWIMQGKALFLQLPVSDRSITHYQNGISSLHPSDEENSWGPKRPDGWDDMVDVVEEFYQMLFVVNFSDTDIKLMSYCNVCLLWLCQMPCSAGIYHTQHMVHMQHHGTLKCPDPKGRYTTMSLLIRQPTIWSTISKIKTKRPYSLCKPAWITWWKNRKNFIKILHQLI